MLPPSIQEKLAALAETYKIDGREDKGANGWLYYATNKVTGLPVAIKFYCWGNEPALHSEPRLLAQFNSPNIVPILSAELVGGGWACFITPRFPVDLEGLISRARLSTHRAIDVGINVLSGLGALHASLIVHRDLKPANIFVAENGVAAIGDFGSVATIEPETGDAPSSKHSLVYKPPECFLEGRFAPGSDLYQLGVTLHEAFGGYLPKDAEEWMTLKEREVYGGLYDDFDRSRFQDEVLRKVIRGGKLLKQSSIPFYVTAKIRRVVAQMTSCMPDARPRSAADAMALLVSARRQTLDWKPVDDGALGTFGGGSVRVLEQDGRVEVQRGRGWRRDRSLEGTSGKSSVRTVEQRLA